MKRNLTLAIEDETLHRARLAATKRRKSLTALVRRFLEELAAGDQERSAAVRRLKKLMASRPLAVGKRGWSRDDLHER
ncbi:MAG: hypothetical protein HYY25_06325 [Candidatus Wallbacteria bacterium]|nr:hypothetical protein [Candidatus Wallbacteria bacterium]